LHERDAERLSILMLQIGAKLDESVAFVVDHDSESSAASYKRVVAELMASVHLDILERLWRDHPRLRPTQMNGSYAVDPLLYEPRFYSRGVVR